jgi:uncharacterized protein YegJ (DUF2314 family)
LRETPNEEWSSALDHPDTVVVSYMQKDMARSKKPTKKEEDEQAKRGIVLLGVLVAALAGLVYWASTSGKDVNTDAEAGADAVEDAAPVVVAKPDATPRGTGALERLPESGGDLTILTDKPEDAVTAATKTEAIEKTLDVPYCGPACDAVKKAVRDKEHFEIETLSGDEMLLPPKDTIDTIAPGLTPKERESVHRRRAAVTVRVRGDVNKEQVAARTLFAVGASLAKTLDGLVWDETTRRVETAEQTRLRAITAPLGAPAFNQRAIVIQFYRQPDATARLVTLGMSRFGAPDLSLRGCSMGAGAMLVDAINALAASIVEGKDGLPLVAKTAKGEAAFEVADAERVQGDPDDFVELVPVSGAKGEAPREAWDAVVTKLFGEAARSVEAKFGKELEAAGAKARKEMPAVLKRFTAGEGELFVWGPFTIRSDERADGGPEEEWLWVKVSTCDDNSCTGALSNRPMYATNIASGRTTSMPRAKIADWQLRYPDGGITGGETTRLLQQPDAGSTQR